MGWLDGDWSEMIRVSEAIEQKWWEKLPPEYAGVYRLVALTDSHSLVPSPISRVCGVDDTGTLYVGASKGSLAVRVSDLIKTYHRDYKSSPHRELPKRLADRFPDDKLAISWELTNEPWVREAKLLTAYENSFGELPPNLAYPVETDNHYM